MDQIVKGYKKFKAELTPDTREMFRKLASGQSPKAMFITCADSRIVPETITSSGPGDLFVARNVGNIVPPYAAFTGGVSAAIEYAVQVLEVKHLIVCGHSDCGAMKAVLKPPSSQSMSAVSAWLRHSEAALQVTLQLFPEVSAEEKLQHLTEQNVLMQLNHLRTHPAVAAKLAQRTLQLHGWIYDIESCDIKAYSTVRDAFIPLDQAFGEEALEYVVAPDDAQV